MVSWSVNVRRSILTAWIHCYETRLASIISRLFVVEITTYRVYSKVDRDELCSGITASKQMGIMAVLTNNTTDKAQENQSPRKIECVHQGSKYCHSTVALQSKRCLPIKLQSQRQEHFESDKLDEQSQD